jgi:hypothetical protein
MPPPEEVIASAVLIFATARGEEDRSIRCSDSRVSPRNCKDVRISDTIPFFVSISPKPGPRELPLDILDERLDMLIRDVA